MQQHRAVTVGSPRTQSINCQRDTVFHCFHNFTKDNKQIQIGIQQIYFMNSFIFHKHRRAAEIVIFLEVFLKLWDQKHGCSTIGIYSILSDTCNDILSVVFGDKSFDYIQPYVIYHCIALSSWTVLATKDLHPQSSEGLHLSFNAAIASHSWILEAEKWHHML